MNCDTDILIIGSGIAGLSLALKAAQDYNVVIVTKKDAIESNTRYAQGGVASAVADSDNFDSHIQDTLTAGAHLGDPNTIEKVVRQGPKVIEELSQIGVNFSKTENDEFDLGIEGGHSNRRVLHAKDLTGYEIESKLLDRVRANSKISVLEYHAAIDLIVDRHLKIKKGDNICYGAYALNRKSGDVATIKARATVLATGGAGKTYLYTSNPDVATGDGIAMAYRAGCDIANLEFVQFHPTCLHHPRAKSFLISEALRGEGGKLRLTNGDSFMTQYDERAELAPRDIVARAIDYELKKRGDRHVNLDMTQLPKKFIKERFPHIHRTCQKFGYNMLEEPLPVVPAAHYFCGGVSVNENGKTSMDNLYAIGEVSCTGLHGANRLASNSLLEGAAFSDFVYQELRDKTLPSYKEATVRNWDTMDAADSDEVVVITQNWDELRRMMWNYVGIVRSTKRLIRAQRRINILLEEIKEYYWNFILTTDLLELRNITCVADLTIKCALKREESIGLHYNIDHPEPSASPLKLNIIRKDD